MGGERTLTEAELNRALLERQMLLGRSRLSVTRALERMGGLQAQYAPSMYIGLWSRLQGLERAAVTRALERRAVVQATLLRGTIHLVSARDYWPFAAAIRRPRLDWWLRAHGGSPDRAAVTAAAAQLRERLERGPASRAELLAALDGDTPLFNGAVLVLDLVRVPPSGTWEHRRAHTFGLAETWLAPDHASPSEALLHVARRYLRAFGPALVADVAGWAGITITEARSALDRLELRRFRDTEGRTLVDLPRAPLPGAGLSPPVRFLPTWDAVLLTHARRTQILPERFRPLIFNTKLPQSLPTFTVDGRVAGTWRHAGGRVLLEPFEPLPRVARREAEEEAGRLAAFLD